VKDYSYPKNGRIELNGMISRTTMPPYMKDVKAYASHPLMTVWHKQSPLVELTRDLASDGDESRTRKAASDSESDNSVLPDVDSAPADT
jgi:hypothetical protein